MRWEDNCGRMLLESGQFFVESWSLLSLHKDKWMWLGSHKEHGVGGTVAALWGWLSHPGAMATRDRSSHPEGSGALQAIPSTAVGVWHGVALTLSADEPLSYQLSTPQLACTCFTGLLHSQVHTVAGLFLLHQHVWSSPRVLEVPLERIRQDLCHLFCWAAYGIVSKASSSLFKVGAWCTTVSRGNRYLTTSLCTANATWRCAWWPGSPWSHHTVDGCRYLAHLLVILAAVSGSLTVGIAVAHSFSLGVFKTLVISPGAAVWAVPLSAASVSPWNHQPGQKISKK